MRDVPLHVGPDLPIALDVAVSIIGVAAVVFLLVAYQFYREYGGKLT